MRHAVVDSRLLLLTLPHNIGAGPQRFGSRAESPKRLPRGHRLQGVDTGDDLLVDGSNAPASFADAEAF